MINFSLSFRNRLSSNRPTAGWIVQQEVARMMDTLLDPFSSFASFSKPVRRTNQSTKRSHFYRSSSQQTQTPNVVTPKPNRANNGKIFKNSIITVYLLGDEHFFKCISEACNNNWCFIIIFR